MNDRELWRLNNLQSPWVDAAFLKETHKIEWPPDQQFLRDFNAWIETNRRAMKGEVGKIHRYDFENFLQSQRLVTRAYAAASLGMKPKSLDSLLCELPKIGLSKKYAVYDGIIDESLNNDLIRSLKGMRFRTFGTHDSFCERLQGELRDELNVEFQQMYCETAAQLGEPSLYAATWDNLTLLPLSIKHSVWLDLKKPLNLPPDRCSKLFLAQNEELTPLLAGFGVPRDLRYYTDFARRSA